MNPTPIDHDGPRAYTQGHGDRDPAQRKDQRREYRTAPQPQDADPKPF